jgi:hypothetical protein
MIGYWYNAISRKIVENHKDSHSVSIRKYLEEIDEIEFNPFRFSMSLEDAFNKHWIRVLNDSKSFVIEGNESDIRKSWSYFYRQIHKNQIFHVVIEYDDYLEFHLPQDKIKMIEHFR